MKVAIFGKLTSARAWAERQTWLKWNNTTLRGTLKSGEEVLVLVEPAQHKLRGLEITKVWWDEGVSAKTREFARTRVRG